MSETSAAEIAPGCRVRLKRNPSRTGTVGEEVIGSGRRQKVLVHFVDGSEDHILLGELERDGQLSMAPLACISRGDYAGVQNLRTMVTHYRLSGRLANLIYSLNTTNTLFRAHQFKPVLQFLESPCNGILIADEVGLGKTIEAGLIWTELRARAEARRLLVVCPAMLRDKWRDELFKRFGVRAALVDASELLEYLQAAQHNPRQEFALVASMQGLRPPRDYEALDNQQGSARLARFLSEAAEADDRLLDFLVIDEAHYLRNAETQTNALGQLLRQVSDGIVLLSATPIQLRRSDLFSLIKLLDESVFPDEHSFDFSLQLAQPILQLRDEVMAGRVSQEQFVTTLRELMAEWKWFLADSQQLHGLLQEPPSDQVLSEVRSRGEIANRLDRIHPLSKLVTRTLKRDVEEDRVQREPVAFRATLSPLERQFYDQVTELVRQYCDRQNLLTGFILTIPQRQMASCMAAACRAWQQRITGADGLKIDETFYELEGDDPEQDYCEPDEMGSLVRALVEIAHSIGSYEQLKREDSKYGLLRDSLKKYLRQYPDKKIVLFSFFRQTLAYLHERLAEDGITSVVLQGGGGRQRNQQILQTFELPTGSQVLLSSEVASEGIDLQFSSLLINYDLPWNPMRIEQRIGRIDRIGQPEKKILIWNLMNADTIDERIYDRLLDRLDVFRQSLGRMESVLGDVVKKMTLSLFRHRLTAKEEQALIESNLLALEERRRREEQLEAEAPNLVAHGDFILNKVKAARELNRTITGEDIFVYVNDFLARHFPGSRLIPLDEGGSLYQCELSSAARVEFDVFIQERMQQGSTRLLSSRPLPLKFENMHGLKPADYERVAQDHVLVRFISNYQRQPGKLSGAYPVSAICLDGSRTPAIRPGVYAFAIFRWSFTGAVTREQLEYLAIPLDGEVFLSAEDSESLVNAAALYGEDWLSAKADIDPERAAERFDECRAMLATLFTDTVQRVREENQDRISLMIRVTTDRADSEVARLRTLMQRLQSEGKSAVVRMTSGKINRVWERLDARKQDLLQKRNMHAEDTPVVGGMIKVI
ncbi:SNF2-related protein [Pseudomonas boanensis]|uniref:SNF2-related protein n=1 Tax=Metapseudomonas boanensis TaxID=2822138 RepID=UPI0035D4915A